jgi:serine/threonine-protein kinase
LRGGSLREGPYWFLVELGRGSTADVYLVANEAPVGLEKLLVLKRLKRDLLEEPELVRMFLDEGRLAARLAHSNIMRTVEVATGGVGESIGSGRPYIVMEYIEGRSVHELVHAVHKGQLAVERDHWIAVVMDILAALDYAHGLSDFDGTPLGLVHRDVSPGNVLVSYAGEVKLTDFGIAKAKLRSGHTAVGTIKGKARYMAPEQIEGGPVDPRADIFATGVLLWELLAGRSPWKQPLRLDERGNPPVLSSVLDDVPAELDAICERALGAEPDDRYQSACEMLEALDRFVERHGRRITRHELGKLMSSSFATERAERSAIIGQQLAEMRQKRRGGGESLVKLPRRLESVPPEGTSVSVKPDRERRGKQRPILHSAVIAIAIATLGAGLLLSGRQCSTKPSDVTVASDGATTTLPSAPVPAPADVEIYIVAIPPEATISVDGSAMSANPYTGRRKLDGRDHRVRIEAPGYEPVEQTVRYDRDVVLRVKLESTPPAASTGWTPPLDPEPVGEPSP